MNSRLRFLILLPLFCFAALSAQQSDPTSTRAHSMLLDVVVTEKSGSPVSGLRQQDFTILDNKVKQPITSFRAVDGRQAQIDIILVIDTVNASYTTVGFERDQIGRFLREDQGKLAHPVSLAVLTDTGLQILQGFSNDGNVVAASLDQYAGNLRNFRRSGGFFDAEEIFQISLSGLRELADRESDRDPADPTRKVMIWVSPGWPLLSGPDIELSDSDQQRLFGDIVDFSNLFWRGRITLYSIDPLGPADSLVRTNYWKSFVKGVSKPTQVMAGDLALQVLATQTGGLALNSNNLIALLAQCVADTGSYYEISFSPPSSDKSKEYHALEVQLAKKGFTVRTRMGFYSKP